MNLSFKMSPTLIPGNKYSDDRGTVRFVNNFDLSPVVRIYTIQPIRGVIRAWQGHKQEQKWFFATEGQFEVKVVEVVDWETLELGKTNVYILDAAQPSILHVPAGYLNGILALSSHSNLFVFSDMTLVESKADDIRFSLDQLPWDKF